MNIFSVNGTMMSKTRKTHGVVKSCPDKTGKNKSSGYGKIGLPNTHSNSEGPYYNTQNLIKFIEERRKNEFISDLMGTIYNHFRKYDDGSIILPPGLSILPKLSEILKLLLYKYDSIIVADLSNLLYKRYPSVSHSKLHTTECISELARNLLSDPSNTDKFIIFVTKQHDVNENMINGIVASVNNNNFNILCTKSIDYLKSFIADYFGINKSHEFYDIYHAFFSLDDMLILLIEKYYKSINVDVSIYSYDNFRDRSILEELAGYIIEKNLNLFKFDIKDLC